MSVRMAIVKLAALGAAGALIGGGAVHMAEKAKEGPLHYAKHAPTCAPQPHHRRVTTTTTTTACAPEEQEAAIVPQNPPEVQNAPEVAEAQPLPGPYYTSYYASTAHRHHHHHHYAPPPPPPAPEPTPVPAPPMLVLFGAAASALVARRALAQRKARVA